MCWMNQIIKTNGWTSFIHSFWFHKNDTSKIINKQQCSQRKWFFTELRATRNRRTVNRTIFDRKLQEKCATWNIYYLRIVGSIGVHWSVIIVSNRILFSPCLWIYKNENYLPAPKEATSANGKNMNLIEQNGIIL